MKELSLLNPENVSEGEAASYDIRTAARAIVVDEHNKIALLHVRKHNYYKLPGGGLEGDEDPKTALQRECLEEIGTNIEVIGEVGKIIEYRKFMKLKQISYCYIARAVGDVSATQMTEHEKENDFQQTWLSYDEAMKCMTLDQSQDFEGAKYIVMRDTEFLKEVGKVLNL